MRLWQAKHLKSARKKRRGKQKLVRRLEQKNEKARSEDEVDLANQWVAPSIHRADAQTAASERSRTRANSNGAQHLHDLKPDRVG
jgi:hypothetical protein